MMVEEDVRVLENPSLCICKVGEKKSSRRGLVPWGDYQWDPRKIRELLWGTSESNLSVANNNSWLLSALKASSGSAI